MSVIKELSPHVANLIAAGEVVERPASVVKELIENAIDAKATRIQVEIERGGISYIRIMDNGIGMSKEDVPIAFRRHATSKLKNEKDLSSIETLGFRGEALAAIASVSKIDIFTKQDNRIAGFHMNIEAGEINECEEVGCPKGTTIIIRDLFFNTPARMKFLKKDFTEAGYVAAVLEHAALSHPEISFGLLKDGRQIFYTSGDKRLMTPIFNVFGREITLNMVEVKLFEREQISTWGYITKPHLCRANRNMQHFFVNGRYVKNKIMQTAFEEAYKNRIISGKYPSCALFLKVPLNLVDVNVHPAKTEVKFAIEREIFEVVYIACKNTLENNDNVPLLKKNVEKQKKQDFLTEKQIIMDILPKKGVEKLDKKNEIKDNENKKNKNVPTALFNIKKAKLPKEFKPPLIECEDDFDDLIKVSTFDNENNDIKLEYENLKNDKEQNLKIDSDLSTVEIGNAHKEHKKKSEFLSDLKIIGEAFNTYIVAQDKDGFILLDKHAAHERIIFNELKKNSEISQQILLTPYIAETNVKDFEIICQNIEQIEKLGFDISVFGDKSFAVRSIPSYIDCADINEILSEIVEKIENYRCPLPDIYDDIIHMISCKAAIKAGKSTSMTEMENLLEKVMSNNEISSCPHGRPVMIRLTKYEIDKMFKRVNQ